ncbi:MAG: phosphotransferase [Thermoplasmatota archaeon]
MIINADLHIHSHFSKYRQPRLDFTTLAANARLKGLDVVSTGDCLHPYWLKEISKLHSVDGGIFYHQNIIFILSTEIQTNDNVHHLLYFPDLTSVHDLRSELLPRSKDIDTDGKPSVDCDSETIAGYAHDVNALIGPAHIFDATSGLYAHYPSLKRCYGIYVSLINFAELGLGGNSQHADTIKELHRLTYLTSSDTHNSHPIRLGREFTRFIVKKPSFACFRNALIRKDENYPILNIGIPPEEGKYFESACSRCHTRYTIEDADMCHWRCRCGSFIKKGVRETIKENATFSESQHPIHRPLYLSFLPLHEIISKALHQQNPFNTTVMNYWHELIFTFGNEIRVLLDTPIEDIAKITLPSITEAINAFRQANIQFNPGGGGLYGSIMVPWEEQELLVSLKTLELCPQF